ncbi:MAG: hypothetical protein ABIK28_22505 [Planctomycetota bacterium]
MVGKECYIVSCCTLNISYTDVDGGQASVGGDGSSYTLNWGSGMIDADPLFWDPESGLYYLGQDPCQPGITNPCVNTGSDVAWWFGMDVRWTRMDGVADSGQMDMGFHYGYETPQPPLTTDACTIVGDLPGTMNMVFDAGFENAGDKYFILCGLLGTSPGQPLPGGLIVPCNWDVNVITLVCSLNNIAVFFNFFGFLDANGKAYPRFEWPGYPGSAGLIIYFAGCTYHPFDFVTNPVQLELVP